MTSSQQHYLASVSHHFDEAELFIRLAQTDSDHYCDAIDELDKARNSFNRFLAYFIGLEPRGGLLGSDVYEIYQYLPNIISLSTFKEMSIEEACSEANKNKPDGTTVHEDRALMFLVYTYLLDTEQKFEWIYNRVRYGVTNKEAGHY